MKKFTFESIWMLSHRDRSALQVNFHHGKNLIWGKNHTGKSSLIKTMFLTMGAKAKGGLLNWDDGTVSLVEFRIDGKLYKALHQNGARAVFDEKDNLLVATGEPSVWNSNISSILGFNLVLSSGESDPVQADARCFFMPFYINQDGSWQANWNTFVGDRKSSCPMGPILEYFSGIKPPDYYEAKALRDLAQKRLDVLKGEYAFLKKAKDRFGERLSFDGPKIDSTNFQAEIERLTVEITELNSRQEVIRERVVKENELLSSIKHQIHFAEAALNTYDKDSKFLRSEGRDILVCPVCNAEHSDPFMDYLVFAEDARSLKEAIIRLEKDADLILAKIKVSQNEFDSLNIKYALISEILETRRGELQFKHVVESLSGEHALRAFEAERTSIEREMSDASVDFYKYTDKMNMLSDRSRSNAIMEIFRNAYAYAANELRLPDLQGKRPALAHRPDLSGSGGPRSVLAYYSALWDVANSRFASFCIPIVVDSPNQQGQDAINLPKVIEFVSTKLPSNAQLILSSETDVPWPFDNKVHFNVPYQVMTKSKYDEIGKKMTPLVDKMYTSMKREKNLFGDWE